MPRPDAHSPASQSAKLEGASGADCFELAYQPLDEAAALKHVRSAGSGATCVFVGTTRDSFAGQVVTHLEYEAYTSMALKQLRSIAQRARAGTLPRPEGAAAAGHGSDKTVLAQQDQLLGIYVSHRLGIVPVGEASVVIAVASGHRRAAFAAAEAILEELKRSVPIWKREFYADGSKNDEARHATHASGADAASEPAWKANFPPTSR